MNNEIFPGKGFSFTPSRNANWTDEYNAILKEEDISRNKLTERLIVLGLKAKNSNRKLDVNRTNSNTDFLLNSSLFTEEQIELLQTTHYRRILESFALHLFNSTAKAEKETIDKFILEQEIIEPSIQTEKFQNEEIRPAVVSEKIEVAATIEKEDVKPSFKKANIAELSKMISSFKND